MLGVPGVNQDLSVHHIEPLEERFDLRLENDNLVTCCSRHHEMAEAGKIPREYLHALAQVSPRWGGHYMGRLVSRPTAAPWAQGSLEMRF